jgi:nitric oxide reductase NorQ protein
MKRTMAVLSLGYPSIQGWRHDIIADPHSQHCFARMITPESTRPRWKIKDLNRIISCSDQIITGPALIEVSDQEADEIASSGRLPRNIQLRAESVRQHLAAHPEPGPGLNDLQQWLTIWRGAVANMDETWLRLNTNKHGKTRTNAVKAVKPAATPVVAPSGNAVRISSAGYEPVVKGWVKRPSSELYRCRKIGKRTDVDVLRQMRDHGVHCLTTGVPGTGKSALKEAAFGPQMITVLGTEDLEAADLQGSYVEVDDAWVWVDGPLIIAMEQGLVFYLDEIGVVRPKQMAQLYALMDGRGDLLVTANPKRGVVKAQPGFIVVASTNLDSPEVRMTEAVMNRFGLKIQVETDYKMAAAQFGIPEWLTGASENLEVRRKSKEISWSPQTRDLILWRKNAEILGDEHLALGSMINSAPAAAQATVSEVLSKASGKKVRQLVLV